MLRGSPYHGEAVEHHPVPRTSADAAAQQLCGFTPTGDPFHFEGAASPPPVFDSLPLFPAQQGIEGGGLPALARPDVVAARSRWLREIDKLIAAPGADVVLLRRVRAWAAEGVRSEFIDGSPPPQQQHANTHTFKAHEAVCMERMRVYEDMGAMRRLAGLPPPGAHVQPLHAVVRPGKKARVCFDLARNFNDHVVDEGFSMASVQHAVELAKQSPTPAFFSKLDISACFLSFPIHPDDHLFFYCEAGGDFFQFLALVFGRKDAPRVCSLLLDVVSAAMVDAGVPHMRYLDDFLFVATTSVRCWACTHTAASLLCEFGLAISLPKFEGPLQRIEFLGIVIDSVKETLEISSERQAELLSLLEAFGKRKSSSLVRMQSLLGKLAFAATVLPGAKPFMRRIIDTTVGRRGGQLHLSVSFRSECRYWRDHLRVWNGTERWRAPESAAFVFASDASTSGFAYGLEACEEGKLQTLPPTMRPGVVRSGSWSAANGDAGRQQTSSNIQWGEFFCPLAAAVEFGPLLADSHVVFAVDNESDVHVINRLRSREPRVAALLRCLCDVAVAHNFSFKAVHRAGVDNVLMDWASRPAYHRFRAMPAVGELLALAPARVAGGVEAVCAYPPLLSPSSLSHISSRCLKFGAEGNSARWQRAWPGSSSCVAACT